MKRIFSVLIFLLATFVFAACDFGSDLIETDPSIESIVFDETQLETGYQAGAFTLSNLVLTIRYDNGTETNITITEAMVTGLDQLNTPGTHTLTITYDDFEVTFDVIIIDPQRQLENMFVDPSTIAESYAKGAFDLSDLELVLVYDDNSEERISIHASMVTGLEQLNASGTHTLRITYEEFVTDITIVVTEPQLVAIAIQPSYVESSYEVGTFDFTTLKLTLIYDDDSTELIDITASMINGLNNLDSAGTHMLTITYNNLQTTVDIVITEADDEVPTDKEAAADSIIAQWDGSATLITERLTQMQNAMTIIVENKTIMTDSFGYTEEMNNIVEITYYQQDGIDYLWLVQTLDVEGIIITFEQIFVLSHDTIDIYMNLGSILPLLEADMDMGNMTPFELFAIEHDWFKITIDDTMQSIIEMDMLDRLLIAYELDVFIDELLLELGYSYAEIDLVYTEIELLIHSAVATYLPYVDQLILLLENDADMTMDKTEDFLVKLSMGMEADMFAEMIATLLMDTYQFLLDHELVEEAMIEPPPTESQIRESLELLPSLTMDWMIDPLDDDAVMMYLDLSPYYNMVMDMENHDIVFEEVSIKITVLNQAEITLPVEYNDVHRIIEEFLKVMIFSEVIEFVFLVEEEPVGVYSLKDLDVFFITPLYDLELSTFTVTEEDIYIDFYYIDGFAVFTEPIAFNALLLEMGVDLDDPENSEPEMTRATIEYILALFNDDHFHFTRFIVFMIADAIFAPPFDDDYGFEETEEERFVNYSFEAAHTVFWFCGDLDFESPEFANYCVTDGTYGAAYYLTAVELDPQLWMPLPEDYNYAMWMNEDGYWEIVIYNDLFEYYGDPWEIYTYNILPRSTMTLEEMIELLGWENRARPTE